MPGAERTRWHDAGHLLHGTGDSRQRAPRVAAATANVGTAFGWRDVGQIRAGFNADLLVLDADPVVDVANIKKIDRVMLAGALIDRAALLHAGRCRDWRR